MWNLRQLVNADPELICASPRLSTPAAFPVEHKEFISVDHNHPYSSASVQLLDTRLYLRHKTILLLAVLFSYLQYFPRAPVSLSTAKKIFLLMILLYFIWLEYETGYNPCFTTLFAEGSYAMDIPSSSGELSPSLLGDISSSLHLMHSREWQAWVSVCSLSSHNFWISAVQCFQTHPSTSFVFYIFYVAYFIATPTLGLLNTITLQWLLLGEVAAWTATEFPYCWCRSVSSPRSVACWMDASGSILLPHLHP